MRLVVDVNCLANPNLRPLIRSYLLKSRENQLVVTEYLTKEIFSSPNTADVRSALQVFANCPGQIVVLKNNRDISLVRSRTGRGLQKRFISDAGSKNIDAYAIAAARGTSSIVADILTHSGYGFDHITDLLDAATVIKKRMAMEIASFSPSELKLIRQKKTLSVELSERLMSMVIRNTKALFFEVGFSAAQLPDARQLLYCYPFRFTLCLTVLELMWVTHGQLPVRPERIRNSITDMTYAAFGTFFDGLLSRDEDLKRVYTESRHILTEYFRVGPCT